MPLFHIATLGCKVNQYESQSLREAWLAAGLEETRAPEQAAVILVNSCAVTAKAVADVRNAVRRLHRAAPQAAVIVTGCAAVAMADELAALPGVLAVVPQDRKADLKGLVPELVTGCNESGLPPRTPPGGNDSPRTPPIQKNIAEQCFSDNAGPGPQGPGGGVRGGGAPSFPSPSSLRYPDLAVSGYERSRAVLKIQDGCSHGCAYCIVPLTRGAARSRPFAESLAEARRLLGAGFAEIVISGVNLRQYAQEDGGFWAFLSGLDAALAPEWAGRARLRLSSLEPGQLGDEALAALARCRMVAPHLHLSLQSGSASVLRRMGRGHYRPDTLPVFLDRLRAVWPVYGLGADILTGFPGESDGEFEEGLRLVQGLGLTYAHVFPYSRRPGTQAAAMPGQVPQAVKKDRAARLRETARQGKEAFLRQLAVLPELTVVFEDRDGETARGVCEYYADCRLGSVPAGLFDAPGHEPGQNLARDTVRELARGLTGVRPVGTDGETLCVARKGGACD